MAVLEFHSPEPLEPKRTSITLPKVNIQIELLPEVIEAFRACATTKNLTPGEPDIVQWIKGLEYDGQKTTPSEQHAAELLKILEYEAIDQYSLFDHLVKIPETLNLTSEIDLGRYLFAIETLCTHSFSEREFNASSDPNYKSMLHSDFALAWSAMLIGQFEEIAACAKPDYYWGLIATGFQRLYSNRFDLQTDLPAEMFKGRLIDLALSNPAHSDAIKKTLVNWDKINTDDHFVPLFDQYENDSDTDLEAVVEALVTQLKDITLPFSEPLKTNREMTEMLASVGESFLTLLDQPEWSNWGKALETLGDEATPIHLRVPMQKLFSRSEEEQIENSNLIESFEYALEALSRSGHRNWYWHIDGVNLVEALVELEEFGKSMTPSNFLESIGQYFDRRGGAPLDFKKYLQLPANDQKETYSIDNVAKTIESMWSIKEKCGSKVHIFSYTPTPESLRTISQKGTVFISDRFSLDEALAEHDKLKEVLLMEANGHIDTESLIVSHIIETQINTLALRTNNIGEFDAVGVKGVNLLDAITSADIVEDDEEICFMPSLRENGDAPDLIIFLVKDDDKGDDEEDQVQPTSPSKRVPALT